MHDNRPIIIQALRLPVSIFKVFKVKYLNNNGIESLVIHVKLSGYNLFFICIYKPPNINNDHLKHAIDEMTPKCNLESNYIYIIGEMNVNFMTKNNVLIDTLNSFDLKQMIC